MKNEPQIKGRVTSKKFINWLNQKFEELEITQYKCTSVSRTNLRGCDYEAGACKLSVTFESKGDPKQHGNFLCFYFLSEYEQYIKEGKTLVLRFNGKGRLKSLNDLTVEVSN